MAVCVKSGRIVAQGAVGFRRQGQPNKILLTDRVNLASNTKWMTATIAARLVDRCVISWNTRVCDLFTNYPAYNSALTNAEFLNAYYSGALGIYGDVVDWSR